MKLIDADALKEEVNKKNVVGRFNTIMLIDNAPTVEIDLVKVAEEHEKIGFKKGFNEGYAQAQVDLERPQGKWLTANLDKPYGRCNICGEICEIDNFCGSCGANMTKGDAE